MHTHSQQHHHQKLWLYVRSFDYRLQGLVTDVGCSSKQTLILSTPGGVVASLTTLLCGWYSDK